jgi:hypothetical protein
MDNWSTFREDTPLTYAHWRLGHVTRTDPQEVATYVLGYEHEFVCSSEVAAFALAAWIAELEGEQHDV